MLYKGRKFAENSKGNDDEVVMTMETSVDTAESSVAQTQFPITIVNLFLVPDFLLKWKKHGVIITGVPGIGEHNHIGYIVHLTNSIQVNLCY